MRQKWGLVRAVSVAILFSAICFLNNGSRAVHTLLELRAAGHSSVTPQTNQATVDEQLDQSKPDEGTSTESTSSCPAEANPDGKLHD